MYKGILTPEEINSLMMGDISGSGREEPSLRNSTVREGGAGVSGYLDLVEERLLRDAFDTLDSAMIITDSKGAILFENIHSQDLLEKPLSILRNKLFDREVVLLTGSGATRVEDLVGKAIREGKKISLPSGTRVLRCDGSTVPVTGSSIPIRRDGEIEGVMIRFRQVPDGQNPSRRSTSPQSGYGRSRRP